ncbi:hypothetical protein [Halorientalis halophila]|uniref:hypothetical protein n=1 Tax=Halorientalis halophila TaxID=3108499 RepID=UPI0030084539
MSLNRRRVLASLAACGAGAVTGTGTAAVLTDTESGDARLRSGLIDLLIEYWVVSGPGATGTVDPSAPDGVVDGPRIDVPLGTLDGEQPRGSTLLRFALPQPDEGVNNPASLWLRTDCPTPDPLAAAMQVRFSFATADGTVESLLAEGSLQAVAERFRAGVRLDPAAATDDEGCLTDELFVLVEYDLGLFVGTGATSLPLYVAATQCRNADPTANPFGGVDDAPCPPVAACDCCWAIGKVELEGSERFRAGRTYEFTEGIVGYGLRVTDVDGDSGVAFELVATDGGSVPPICEVLVKGGPGDERYDRDEESYGTTTDALEGASDGLVYAPHNSKSGERYGISHVLVRVCAPETDDGGCPDDLVQTAAGGRGR